MTGIIIESSNGARTIRDEMISQIDSLLPSVDDDLFQRLSSLRAEIVLDINRRIASLPSVQNFTPIATTPALVLAHTLLGDGARDDEIINRNKIENPNFIIGGDAIEILV